MQISVDDDNDDFDLPVVSPALHAWDEDEFSTERVDAALRSLNIRPTQRRRAAMRSLLAIEGQHSGGGQHRRRAR
jgi:hypothetical protein